MLEIWRENSNMQNSVFYKNRYGAKIQTMLEIQQ